MLKREISERLYSWKNENKKKALCVIGARQIGKTTIIREFARKEYEYFVEVNFILDKGADQIFDGKLDADTIIENLTAFKMQKLEPGKTLIFLDEIQHCEEFPEVVDSLHIKKDVDIYLTGSNAKMLSSEIATLISGRYVEISMLPLSFKEYVLSTGSSSELARKYTAYVETSSFPYALQLAGQPKELRDYLDGIYNTIVVKDIAQRNKIPDPMMLESVLRFIFDNIGNQLSTKKIADTMTSNGRKIDVKTVEKYLKALMESYIVYQAKRYNVKGKQHLKTLEKYYAVDIGLRYLLLGTSSSDVGHILENIVFLELLRRGNEVFIGKIDDLEVDFVAMDGKQTTYYQVAASVRDEKTLARELASLEKIPDHYPKIVLTLDEDPQADYNGIRRINALDWLMGTVK